MIVDSLHHQARAMIPSDVWGGTAYATQSLAPVLT